MYFRNIMRLNFSTFVCPTEIIAFSDRIAEFKALNAEVVGVSTDSHFSHLAWINTSRRVNQLNATEPEYAATLVS